MKMLLGLLATVSFSLLAHAETPAPAASQKDVLSCMVANSGGQPQVSLIVSVHYDTSADFVIVSVSDKGQVYRMFTQMNKGEVDANLAQGSLALVLLDDTFSQDAGVIRNAGLAVVNQGANGGFSGLLIAHSNIYPLTCKKN